MQAVQSTFGFKSVWSFVKVVQALKRRETDFCADARFGKSMPSKTFYIH